MKDFVIPTENDYLSDSGFVKATRAQTTDVDQRLSHTSDVDGDEDFIDASSP